MYVTYPKGVIIIKKLISTLLTLTLLLCLCACSVPNPNSKQSTNHQESTITQISEPTTSEPLEETIIPTETLTQASTVAPTVATASKPTVATTKTPAQTVTKAPTKNPTEIATQFSTLPAVTVTSADVATFSSLSYYKSDNIATYVAYKQLHPELSIEDVVTYVNIGLHTPFYSNVNTVSTPDNLLVLCNKYNSLGSYEPKKSDLVTLKANYAINSQQLRKEAAEAFYKLSDAANAAGHKIVAVSTYRSYSRQSTVYSGYAKRDGQAKADTYSARPGTSEHQTGLAIDVSADGVTGYRTFGNTASYRWAKDNIHNYGFIIRYPEDKTHITGYMAEPWHFRYVGVETAKKVYESGLTYDEYYVRYIAN